MPVMMTCSTASRPQSGSARRNERTPKGGRFAWCSFGHSTGLTAVFSNFSASKHMFDGRPLKDFRDAWLEARNVTAGKDLRFDDLRGEHASRLVERGVPLSEARVYWAMLPL
jgi:hypothetical protein